jgi:hypothetical protein
MNRAAEPPTVEAEVVVRRVLEDRINGGMTAFSNGSFCICGCHKEIPMTTKHIQMIELRCNLNPQSRRRVLTFLMRLLFVFSWALVFLPRAFGDVDVPFPNGSVLCRSDFLALAEIKALIKPVPGKAGEMGVLEHEEFDSKGNRIQVWCLLRGNGHGGPDLGMLYKPTGTDNKDAVWIGACVFGSGQNGFQTDYAKVTELDKAIKVYNFSIGAITYTDRTLKTLTGLKNLKEGPVDVKKVADEFKAIRWHNFEGPPDGTADWDYCYDLVGGNTCAKWKFEKSDKNKLTIQKTKGKYTLGRYDITEDVEQNPLDAPKEFKNLKFDGNQITLGNGDFSA